MLSNAFDDLSSISDDEERTSDDLAHSNIENESPQSYHHQSPMLQQNTSALAQSTPPIMQKLHTSTPLTELPSKRHFFGDMSDHTDLKLRLNEADQDISVFRKQVANLNSELEFYKKQLAELNGVRTQLNETKSELRICKNECDSLRQALESLKNDNVELTIENKCLKAKVQCGELDRSKDCGRCNVLNEQLDTVNQELESFKKDNRILARKVASLNQVLAESSSSKPAGKLVPLDKMKEITNAAKEQYQYELEEKFRRHLAAELERANNRFKDEINKAQEQFEENVKERLLEARDAWNNELSQQVTRVTEWLRNYFDTTIPPPQSELQAMFLPLQRLWVAFLNSIAAATEELTAKHDAVVKAKEELDQALNDSRTEMNTSHSRQFEQLQDELKHMRVKKLELEAKLSKYKAKYFQTVKNHEVEMENAKREFAELLRTKSLTPAITFDC